MSRRAPAAPKPLRDREESGGLDRLQKVLAHAGIGSRRACEEVITQGRVTVDGKVVRELGSRVDPRTSKIAVDGQRIHLERMVYYAVNKPKGYVSTNNDPSGRPRVVDLLPEIPQRVYTVGRLDEMSTGLILLTNDGELANRLAHPKFGVEKLYRVVVAGSPEREVLTKLTEGIWLAEGKVRARRVRVVGRKGQSTVMEMVLAEGKNREVRRMLAKFGHKVMTLTRVAVGPIGLKGLAPGEHRPLTAAEIEMLRKVAAGITLFPPRFSDRKPTRATPRPRPPEAGGRDRGPVRERERDREGPGGRPAGPYSRPPQRRTGGPVSGGPRRSIVPSPAPRGKPGGTRRPIEEGGPMGPAGIRPPRPAGPPPSQRRPIADGEPMGPAGIRPPRPAGPPPSQRRPIAEGGPPRPAGPHPSRRPAGPSTGGPPRRPAPHVAPRSGPPARRIIGLDSGPGPGPGPVPPPRPQPRRTPPKRKFPRASLGPRKAKPSDEGGE